MFPNALVNQLKKNQYRLYSNLVSLVTETTTTTVVNGTPTSSVVESVQWSGKGSIQYVRPRIQKSIADEHAGTMEDSISAVAYLPYEAMPDESMLLVDTDGVLGDPGQRYEQSRKPANVGGVNVYWEVYLGQGVNA